jgi:tRNA (guanine6-N2)-methyltransferase
MPGVEEIAWLEIRSRLKDPNFGEYLFAKEQNGIVTFDYNGSPSDLLQLRTTEDVFLQAMWQSKVTRSWRDLRKISDNVRNSSRFGRAVEEILRSKKPKGQLTYRVISRKYGKHQYRRKDVAKAVHHGIKARYPRWRPVADNAKLEIWVNVLGSSLLIGLRLSDRSMRHRYKKAVELEASLRPSVAAAMVYLTRPKPEDRFFDPMCGSGTLLLERQFTGPYGHILGGDISADRSLATWRNLAAQRKDIYRKAIYVSQWDGRSLPLATGSMNKAATNLPFGKQIGSTSELKALYLAFFGELERVLAPNGRAVVLSSEYDLVKESLRRYPALKIDTGYSIAVLGQWGRVYIVDRCD